MGCRGSQTPWPGGSDCDLGATGKYHSLGERWRTAAGIFREPEALRLSGEEDTGGVGRLPEKRHGLTVGCDFASPNPCSRNSTQRRKTAKTQSGEIHIHKCRTRNRLRKNLFSITRAIVFQGLCAFALIIFSEWRSS